MHVLTLPRVLRRHDGEETGTWTPVTVPVAPIDIEAAAVTQRVERRVDGLGLGSVAKLALLFYTCVFASLAGGVLIVWTAIATLGYVHRFEHFMRSIVFRGFVVSTDGVVLGLIGVAGALTLLATFLTLVVASAYNIVGATGHGLVLRMSESTTLHAEPGDPLPDEPAPDEAQHAA